MAVAEERVRQQGTQRGSKNDGVGQAPMPEQRVRAKPELDPDDIQVWNDRAGYANEQQGWGEGSRRQQRRKRYGHNRMRQH